MPRKKYLTSIISFICSFLLLFSSVPDIIAEYGAVKKNNKDIIANVTVDQEFAVPIVINTKSTVSLTPLKEVYKDFFMIGNIINPSDIGSQRYEFIKDHFNALTAENHMKPDHLWSNGNNPAPNFTTMDNIMRTIKGDGFLMHGHALAWHSQSPAWLNTGTAANYAIAKANLKKYIDAVAKHYANDPVKVYSWDVLNEAMKDGPSNPTDWKNALRTGTQPTGAVSNWYGAYSNGGNGWDYVYDAFLFAREADPDAILYYNDYNLDNTNKSIATASMVKELNAKYAEEHPEANGRKLIEGVGMQGHYSTTTNPDNVEASIKRFIDASVILSITELDIMVNNVSSGGLTIEQERTQALLYAKLFKLFKQYSGNIERVTFWGLDDVTSWRRTYYPCLFNGDLSPKESYYAVLDPDDYIDRGGLLPSRDGTAIYGTPGLGGEEIDEIWSNTEILPVDRHLTIKNGAYGTAQVMWDDNNLYTLVTVSDPVLNNSNANTWEQDSIEIYVDESNSKSGSYITGMGQYRVSYTNLKSYGGSTDNAGFESYTRIIPGGYVVEAKIPFKTLKPSSNGKIGFDMQINDANSAGVRQDISLWSDMSGQSYQNGSKWGTLTLIREDEPPVPVVTGLYISTYPDKSKYIIGDTLDLTGLTVKASLSDESETAIDIADCIVTGFDSDAEGIKKVKISYDGFSVSFRVTVNSLPLPATIASLATPSASYVSPMETVYNMNDLVDPENSGDRSGKSGGKIYSNQPKGQDEPDIWQWVQYDFDRYYEINSTEIYWFQDGNVCMAPENWKAEIWKDGKWLEVSPRNALSLNYGTELDKYNVLEFEPVVTQKLRVSIKAKGTEASTGILQWKVNGTAIDNLSVKSGAITARADNAGLDTGVLNATLNFYDIAEDSALIYIAAYNSYDKLNNCSVYEADLTDLKEHAVSISLDKSVDKVKVFVWDSKTFIPLAYAYEIEKA